MHTETKTTLIRYNLFLTDWLKLYKIRMYGESPIFQFSTYHEFFSTLKNLIKREMQWSSEMSKIRIQINIGFSYYAFSNFLYVI